VHVSPRATCEKGKSEKPFSYSDLLLTREHLGKLPQKSEEGEALGGFERLALLDWQRVARRPEEAKGAAEAA